MSDDKKYTVPISNKSITIPIMLFAGITSILLFQNDDPELLKVVQKGLDDKLNAMYKRQLYSAYHDKNLTPEQRESARLKYLDEIGLNPDFWYPVDYESN